MKETKRSKVKSAERYETNGVPFQDKYNNYYFKVEFENGDVGSYATNKDKQDKFIIGQEVEYEIEENGVNAQGNKKYKVRIPKPDFKKGGGSGWQPKSLHQYKMEAVVPCMRQTVDLIVAGILMKEDIDKFFDTSVNHVWRKMDELGEAKS
jgi:hypothetical protein